MLRLFYDWVTYDVFIRNGRWFEGTDAPSAIRNLDIHDGKVVAREARPLGPNVAAFIAHRVPTAASQEAELASVR
jgi:hypothetical protein